MKEAMKYKKRLHYLEKIEPFINQNIIKIIVGQRRIGKSYYLFQLMDFIKEKFPNPNIIYLNKENLEFVEINDFKSLHLFIDSKIVSDKMNYIFIDEIQEISEFEKTLRHFQLQNNVDIYCTGSNAKMLSGEIATMLGGRYILQKIYSLSFIEFLEFHNLENNNQSLQKYLRYGGLPYLINLISSDEVYSDYLKNIYSSILYKDVIWRNNIRNFNFLEALVKYLAHNTGNIISAKKISDYLKSQRVNISPQTVINYLEFLEQAFFIFKAQRIDLNGKNIFESGEKYYFEDLGLKNAITSYKPTYINQLIENAIYHHLKIFGYEVQVGYSGKKEIDFVASRNDELIYIQASYLISNEEIENREFGNLLEIKDNYPKYVISLDEFSGNNYKGITHLHLRDFLSKAI